MGRVQLELRDQLDQPEFKDLLEPVGYKVRLERLGARELPGFWVHLEILDQVDFQVLKEAKVYLELLEVQDQWVKQELQAH